MATAVVEVDGVMVPREESMVLGVRTSRTLGHLAGALAAAQAEFPAITKDRTARVESKKGEASSYSYAYAALADVLSAVRPHLAKNGLAILQPMAWNGSPWLVTCLVHSSGEWMASDYKLTEYERPQDMGSAITYARRYALTALIGIAAEEEDDGQRAQTGRQRGRRAMPDCPECHTAESVIVSKYGEGYYCHSCKGKFLDRTEEAPAPTEAASVPDDPYDPFGDDDYPNDPTAHERHGVEPAARPAPRPASAAGAPPPCPTCKADGDRVMHSKQPQKSRYYCKSCGKGYGEPVK